MRGASFIKIINRLHELRARVRKYDFVALENAKKTFGEKNNLFLNKNFEETLNGVGTVVLVTECEEYRSLTPLFLKKKMRENIIIDGRRAWNPTEFESN